MSQNDRQQTLADLDQQIAEAERELVRLRVERAAVTTVIYVNRSTIAIERACQEIGARSMIELGCLLQTRPEVLAKGRAAG